MRFNTWLTLTVLSVLFLNSNAKKCCNKDCTTAISKGRAIKTFQDHYAGFLTYLAGDVVTVLSKYTIQGIEFFEAEVGGKTGYIEAAAVKEYSAICTPIEVNDGVHFFSKTKDSRSNADELNIFSSEHIFGHNPQNQSFLYGILQCLSKSETLEYWKEIIYLLMDMDSFTKHLEWYIYGDGRIVIIATLIVCITIISNVWVRGEMKLKEEQILKLVEKAAHIDVENFDLKTKMNIMEMSAKDLEDKLDRLSKEKADFEQNEISTKDNERIHELNMECLREKVQQLEANESAMQDEISDLTLANKHCVSTIEKLRFETETLEAYKIQLENDKRRLETELDQKDEQLAEDFDERNQQLSRTEYMLNTSHVQKQPVESQCQCDDYKFSYNIDTAHLETASADSEESKELLKDVQEELEVCKTHLAKEKAKSEVIVEFYKDTLHTHSCNYLKSADSVNLSLFKQSEELRDRVQQLEVEMSDLELSYINKLNHEMKRSIESLDTLQNVEAKLYKSQRELTKCQKRIALLEAQTSHHSNPGRRLGVSQNI